MAHIRLNLQSMHWALQQGILSPSLLGVRAGTGRVYRSIALTNNTINDPRTHMRHIPQQLHDAMINLPDEVLYPVSDPGELLSAIGASSQLRPIYPISPRDMFTIISDHSIRVISTKFLELEKKIMKEQGGFAVVHDLDFGIVDGDLFDIAYKKPRVFHLFGNLPIEIQIIIWGIAAHTTENSTINVRAEIAPNASSNVEDKNTLNVTVAEARYNGRVPSVLHVCQNSRQEAIRSFLLFPIPASDDTTENIHKRVYWKPTDIIAIEKVKYSVTA